MRSPVADHVARSFIPRDNDLARNPFRGRMCCDTDPDRSLKTSIHQDEEPAVVVCEPSPAFEPTPHDDQLMSENRILRLKPALRLEWRGQDGQNKPSQRDHRANLTDSVTQDRRTSAVSIFAQQPW
jgi:hypothetical protein